MNADIVLCGAGIAGVSVAYFLAVRRGVRNILLVDDQPPLSMTSDRSTECYRNWWPGPDDAMVGLMNRSIDLLEELALSSGNIFNMNRRGYLYCTSNPQRATALQQEAEAISRLGAGPLRIYRGSPGDPEYVPHLAEGFSAHPALPDGADLLLDPDMIHRHFPYLAQEIVAALHVRRAGWLSAQQLGMYLLDQARLHGVQHQKGRVAGVNTQGGRVTGVRLQNGAQIGTGCFINAAGPYLGIVGSMLDLDLPALSELHLKLAMKDPNVALGRQAPLVISTDPLALDWDSEERQFLEAYAAEQPQALRLLGELTPGLHTRPEGGPGSQMILVLWEYQTRRMEPVWPVPDELLNDPLFPEVVLRGLSRLIPAARGYIGRSARPSLDGGYYTKTPENRLLAGPLPVGGAFVIGALSGYGIMAACGAADLLAAHVTAETLPHYAPAFALERYQDPDYQRLLQGWQDSGQL